MEASRALLEASATEDVIVAPMPCMYDRPFEQTASTRLKM